MKISKAIKKEAVKKLIENYDPDKTTMPIRVWLDFFEITEKDFLGEKKYNNKTDEEIVRMMRTDFNIHNSVAWSIVKKIREISRIKLEKQNE